MGLLADPGLATDIATHLAEVLDEHLSRQVSDRVRWQTRVVLDPFEAIAEPSRIIDKARRRIGSTDWDVAIAITDLPMQTGDGAVVAELGRADRVALLSLPALGGVLLRRRARAVTVSIVAELAPGLASALGRGGVEQRTTGPGWLRRVVDGAGAASGVTPDDGHTGDGHTGDGHTGDGDTDVELVVGRRSGTVRLLAGMVRANRPWQLTLGLSTALAGAATGSAFGLLYTNVWELGAALQPWRLALATTIAIGVFVAWLVIGHGLWQRQARSRPLGRLLNPGTLLTVTSGVLLFYVILLVINLAAAAVLIPPTYLAEIVGGPVGVTDFVRVALMASILGLVAGAVGSGLEDDHTVRQAAYSNREAERRALLDGAAGPGQGNQASRSASSA